MAIVHMIIFQFKADASDKAIQGLCDHMLELSEKCIHPTTKKPYIRLSDGGKNNSPEGLTGGFTHGFVMWFLTPEDRDYYVHKDPAHREFVKAASKVVEDVRVVDFEPGVF
ncbi:hypothetical protein EJ08DRAFT_586292 [Tothia fuscella]|uniref:Stress-response A/B barrel domain-containing protein n=1 Tax=Tothia fuscella TaxID=1048955 RepID=A0A9P4TZ60_9PEZI|nr:hypothetical protein EJ08DRAFT_586292 [Tothia fuscella]